MWSFLCTAMFSIGLDTERHRRKWAVLNFPEYCSTGSFMTPRALYPRSVMLLCLFGSSLFRLIFLLFSSSSSSSRLQFQSNAYKGHKLIRPRRSCKRVQSRACWNGWIQEALLGVHPGNCCHDFCRILNPAFGLMAAARLAAEELTLRVRLTFSQISDH